MNMYHRMPQPLQNGLGDPSVPSSAPGPLYYDYTEDFETENPRYTAPIQRPFPFPVHTMNDRQLVAPSHDSEKPLTPNRGQKDSAFFDDDSQRTGADEAAEVTKILLDDNADLQTNTETLEQDSPRMQNRQSSTRSRNSVADVEYSDAARSLQRGRGSDIDLLPSQIGRDSIDTFNPSLDIESRDVPTYNYSYYRASTTPRTKTMSPGKQVQVQDIGTPSIRSEQGIILRDEFLGSALDEAENGEHLELHSEPVEPPTAGLGSHHGRRSISAPIQDILEKPDPRRYGKRFNTRSISRSNGQNYSSPSNQIAGPSCIGDEKYSCTHDDRATTSLLQYPVNMNDLTSPKKLRKQQRKKGHILNSLGEMHTNAGYTDQFRHHKRNNAALKISTMNPLRDANEGFLRITRRCSTTPIISPKPISPARQLRVKNSIPQLMKALPPLPGDPNYIAAPTPPTMSDEDEFAEILSPFSFAWPFAIGHNKSSSAVKQNAYPHTNHTLSSQRSIPKLRLRMQLSETSPLTRVDNRPCTSDSNSTKTSAQFDIENTGLLKGRPLKTPKKLKLRSPLNSVTDALPSAMIRRDPVAQRPNTSTGSASQQPRDLFNLRSGVNSAIRQLSRKSPFTSQPDQTDPILSSTTRRYVSAPGPGEMPSRTQINHPQHLGSNATLDAWKPRGLRRHLSNLRSLLARQSGFPLDSDAAPIATIEAIRGNKAESKDAEICLTSLDPSRQHAINRGGVSTYDSSHPHFSQRMRAKLRKWVEGAKSAVREFSKLT